MALGPTEYVNPHFAMNSPASQLLLRMALACGFVLVRAVIALACGLVAPPCLGTWLCVGLGCYHLLLPWPVAQWFLSPVAIDFAFACGSVLVWAPIAFYCLGLWPCGFPLWPPPLAILSPWPVALSCFGLLLL